MLRCRLLMMLAAGLALPAQAQDQRAPLPRFRESISLDTSAVVVRKLATAGEYLADDQIDEAIEILRDISVAHGETVVPAGAGRYVNAARYGHLLVAGLPPAGLAAYRQRVDAQARQWFEQGRARRDEALLRRVVEQAFASSHGDDALWLLGEWAWDRGELSAARAHWTKLLPLPLEDPVPPGQPLPVLRYPDTDHDHAEILARLVLVSIVEGDLERAADELAVFRQQHAASEGELAGRRGRLAEVLEAVLAEAREWTPPAGEAQHQTFAVNPQRNAVLPQPGLDVGHVLWSDTLPPERWQTENPRPALRPDEPLRLFPVVHGDMLLASDGEQIYHWKLLANEPTPVWPAGDRGTVLFPDVPGAVRTGHVPSRLLGVPRHTLTVQGGRLYAKLGSPITGLASDEVHPLPSVLVCLDLSDERQGKRVWELSADELMPNERGWMFEGSPVVDGGRVFVALRRNHPAAQVRIACLDAESGRPVWNRRIGSSVLEVGDRHNLMSHQLLTLGENAVFYSTDMGAIFAVDRRDGRPLWVITYESRKPADIEPLNDQLRNGLVPCLYHRGLLVAAPNDYGGVLAIDAETGLVRWEQRVPDRIRHLLGVGRGKVFVSGNALWGLDLDTGSFRPPHGWGAPAEQNPQVWGYGQGLLVGDAILFPRREVIDVRDQATGRMMHRLRLKEHDPRATGGNLAVAGKHLIVAEPNRIVVFSDTSGLLQQQREVVEANPRSIRAHFELAATQEIAGQLDEALEHFRLAATLPADDRAEIDPQRQARQRRFDLLVRLGLRAAETGDLPQAISRLATAIEHAPDRHARLAAVWQLAEIQAARGSAEHAVRTFQSILADSELAGLPAPHPDARTAAEAARRAIDRLIQDHGHSVYTAFEREAGRQFAAALESGDPRSLAAALEAFPNARAAPTGRLALARLHRNRQEPREAIRVGRQLSERTVDPEARRGLLEVVALAQEDLRCWRLAAATWGQLAGEFPTATLAAEQPLAAASRENVRVAEFVERRLASPPYADELPPDDLAGPLLPLDRLWSRTLPETSEIIVPAGVAPASELQCVLLNDTGLYAIDARTGRGRWSMRIDDSIVWAAYLDAQLAVATRRTLRAVSLDSGDVLWERPLSAEPSLSTGASQPRGKLRFALLEDRVVCLVPPSRIVAIDPDGAVLWEFQPGGAAGRVWLCDDRHVVVQSFTPDRTLVLATTDGRVLADSAGAGEAWLRDPVRISSERFAVVEPARRIRTVSADANDTGWTYSGPASHANADPDLVVAGDGLLVVMEGNTLLSLDPHDGTRRWSRPLSRRPQPSAAELLAADDDHLYSAAEGILRCVAVSDGSTRWQQFLGPPAPRWTTRRLGRTLAAWPANASASGLSATPLVLCDAATGQYVQELVFPHYGPSPEAAALQLHFDWPTCLVIAGTTLHGLGARRSP